jgi:pimeloyl-ACP methyl ester carboxylesterase
MTGDHGVIVKYTTKQADHFFAERPMRLSCLSSVLLIAGVVQAAASGADLPARPIEMLTLAQCAAKPVIVFENGSRETFDTWDKVIAAVRTDANIFAYNRPGYGKSAPTGQPRDGLTIVGELRATLRRQGLQPPYVLVGHSLGGLYMQLFARAYPGEVKGLVLVDALYPGTVKKTEDFPLYTRVAKRLFFNQAVNGEIDEIHRTGTQVMALPWTNQIAVERLINAPKGPGAMPVDFGAFHSGKQLRDSIEALYPNAHTTVVDSDHRMQVATPEPVVAGSCRQPIPRPARLA